jgi:hypothetical protein
MAQSKPVSYPNIVDQLTAVTTAHAALHETVETHVQEHRAALDAKRRQLHVAHLAKALIEKDGK